MEDEYAVRPLRQDELDAWLDHLAETFAAKGTPRERFKAHFVHDPSADVRDIVVAIHVPTGEIASAIRVFRRRVHWRGAVIAVGGIGEVSTRPRHERRGLARRLLEAVIDHMHTTGCVASLLHTGSAAGLYERMGWAAIDLHQSRARIPVAMGTVATREARWEGGAASDIDALHRLHAAFAATRSGLVERTRAYWERWVVDELQTMPRAKGAVCRCIVASHGATDGPIVAYIIVNVKEGLPEPTVHIMELVWDEVVLAPAAVAPARREVFAALWSAAVTASGVSTAATGAAIGFGDRAAVAEICAAVPGAVVIEEDCHRGHMLRLLAPPLPNSTATSSAEAAAELSAAPFTWFTTDGF